MNTTRLNEQQLQAINCVDGTVQVIAAAGSGKCISGDSYVFTNLGIVRMDYLEQLVNNLDELLVEVKSFDLHNQKLIKTNTSHFYNMGITNTIKLKTSFGYELEGTPEHPIIVLDNNSLKFTHLRDINTSSIVLINTQNNIWGQNTSISKKKAYLLGQSIKHETQVEIPPSILQGNREVARSFLQGLFSIKHFSLEDKNFSVFYTTYSKEFAKQLQMLLLNFGIITKMTHGNEFTLTISGKHFNNFVETIGIKHLPQTLQSQISNSLISNFEDNSQFFDTITEITFSKSNVYDFTVPNTHSFVANGFVNHNTTTLITRIQNMIQKHNISPSEILTISFTSASATDLKEQLSKRNIEGVLAGTFHSICRYLLQSIGYDNLLNFPNKYLFKRELETKAKSKNLNIEDILSWISYQQSYGLTSKDDFVSKESLYEEKDLRLFYQYYEDFKTKTNSYDFNDWLMLTLKEYKHGNIKRKWQYVLVDECQDLNRVQHMLANSFCSGNNLFTVGDYFQSIYDWNGAVPELFKDFYKMHQNTTVINMNRNYRSCQNIVHAANNFIRRYNEGYEHYKDTVANNTADGIVKYKMFATRGAEAMYVVKNIQSLLQKGVSPNDIAVIYRNNSSSDYVEHYLKKANIDYSVTSNKSFFDRTEIQGILSVLRLVLDVTDDEAFENLFSARLYPLTFFKNSVLDDLKTISGKKNISLYEAFLDYKFSQTWQKNNRNYFVDYINRLKIQHEKHLSNDKIIDNIVKIFKLKEWMNEKFEASSISDKLEGIENFKTFSQESSLSNFISFCLSGYQSNNNSKKDGITLTTIHKSKGLEYKVTFVIGLEDKNFPSSKSSINSEARLMYVAVTRAKEQLYLSSIGYSKFYTEYTEPLERKDGGS